MIVASRISPLSEVTPDSDAPALVDAVNGTDELMSDKKTEALFGKNLARLQEVKQKYDPDLIFRKWFAIRPTTASV